MSQQELAARAGLRREKLNRIESKEQNIGVDELSRLLDVVGLELYVREKSALSVRQLAPQEFQRASFIDGSKAKVVSWGKIPR